MVRAWDCAERRGSHAECVRIDSPGTSRQGPVARGTLLRKQSLVGGGYNGRFSSS